NSSSCSCKRISVEFPSVENSELSPPAAFMFKLNVVVVVSEAPPFPMIFPASFTHVAPPPLMWVRRCLCNARLEEWVKLRPHSLQMYGRSPVCMRMCCRRLVDWLKALLHTTQTYGLTPRCTFLCLRRLLEFLKALGHLSHGYGHSPVCWRRWGQYGHWKVRKPVCTLRWTWT
uniref:Uncharacterized protein n=1 Tax=Pygocentrus nattereri TaxID=42514 RepID=A0A3B4E7L1_PYGNA